MAPRRRDISMRHHKREALGGSPSGRRRANDRPDWIWPPKRKWICRARTGLQCNLSSGAVRRRRRAADLLRASSASAGRTHAARTKFQMPTSCAGRWASEGQRAHRTASGCRRREAARLEPRSSGSLARWPDLWPSIRRASLGKHTQQAGACLSGFGAGRASSAGRQVAKGE